MSRSLACRLPALVFVLFCAGGCVSTPPTPDTDPERLWQGQQSRNGALEAWYTSGRIGVKTGRRGGSATLQWDFRQTHQHIELYGPFGGRRIIITVNPDRAVLKDTRGRAITGDTAEEVLYAQLGWQVPFSELIYWCRGIIAPDGESAAQEIAIDAAGRLKKFTQGIWQVEYAEYTNIEQFALPRKLTLTSIPGALEVFDDKGRQIGDSLSVKIILKKWDIS